MNKNMLTGCIGDKNEGHNWAKGVKNCLDLFGFSEVWINGGVGHEQAFLRAFKQRMIQIQITLLPQF